VKCKKDNKKKVADSSSLPRKLVGGAGTLLRLNALHKGVGRQGKVQKYRHDGGQRLTPVYERLRKKEKM